MGGIVNFGNSTIRAKCFNHLNIFFGSQLLSIGTGRYTKSPYLSLRPGPNGMNDRSLCPSATMTVSEEVDQLLRDVVNVDAPSRGCSLEVKLSVGNFHLAVRPILQLVDDTENKLE